MEQLAAWIMSLESVTINYETTVGKVSLVVADPTVFAFEDELDLHLEDGSFISLKGNPECFDDYWVIKSDNCIVSIADCDSELA